MVTDFFHYKLHYHDNNYKETFIWRKCSEHVFVYSKSNSFKTITIKKIIQKHCLFSGLNGIKNINVVSDLLSNDL